MPTAEHRRRGKLADELFRTIVHCTQQAAVTSSRPSAEKPAPWGEVILLLRLPRRRDGPWTCATFHRLRGTVHHDRSTYTRPLAMTKLNIIIPGPEIESDADAVAL